MGKVYLRTAWTPRQRDQHMVDMVVGLAVTVLEYRGIANTRLFLCPADDIPVGSRSGDTRWKTLILGRQLL